MASSSPPASLCTSKQASPPSPAARRTQDSRAQVERSPSFSRSPSVSAQPAALSSAGAAAASSKQLPQAQQQQQATRPPSAPLRRARPLLTCEEIALLPACPPAAPGKGDAAAARCLQLVVLFFKIRSHSTGKNPSGQKKGSSIHLAVPPFSFLLLLLRDGSKRGGGGGAEARERL